MGKKNGDAFQECVVARRGFDIRGARDAWGQFKNTHVEKGG